MSTLHNRPSFRAREWLSRLSQISISFLSVVIFFFLDVMDAIMCHVFAAVDQFLEGKTSPCYCTRENPNPSTSLGEDDGFSVESEISQSLRRRRNVFRDVGLMSAFRRRSPQACEKDESSAFCAAEKEKRRWSDCGCESCVSWMNSGSGRTLHVEVKDPEISASSKDSTAENVIFIHGFLSSSSLWKETVFKNLPLLHKKQPYKLFAVDLLGFGRSPKPRNCLYTLKDHLRAIEESLIAPHEMGSFHIVAHSMGCVVALALGAKYAESVKSITLVAPPYFSSANGGDMSLVALEKLAARKIWPPLAFGSAFMSWYEHLGRCACFFLCRYHGTWEWIIKILTRKSDLHFAITDMTCHTHHSAWHTMHNIICGAARLSDEYLNALSRVKMCVIQGTEDIVVPLECSYNLKLKHPEIEFEIIPCADHNTVILGREDDFTNKLVSVWDQSVYGKKST